MRLVFLMGFLGLVVTPSASSPPEAYFSGRDHIDQKLISLIDQSRGQMEMALYEFSSRPLAQALERAGDRGIQMRLVLDPHIAEEKKTVGHLETIHGLTLRYSGSRQGEKGHMHHKFLIVDGQTLVTGSYNWTAGAEYVNYEDILIENDQRVIHGYEQEFEKLWSAGDTVPLHALSHRFTFGHGTPKKHTKRHSHRRYKKP